MTAPRSMERVAARSSRAESGDALTSRWGVPSPSVRRRERARPRVAQTFRARHFFDQDTFSLHSLTASVNPSLLVLPSDV